MPREFVYCIFRFPPLHRTITRGAVDRSSEWPPVSRETDWARAGALLRRLPSSRKAMQREVARQESSFDCCDRRPEAGCREAVPMAYRPTEIPEVQPFLFIRLLVMTLGCGSLLAEELMQGSNHCCPWAPCALVSTTTQNLRKPWVLMHEREMFQAGAGARIWSRLRTLRGISDS